MLGESKLNDLNKSREKNKIGKGFKKELILFFLILLGAALLRFLISAFYYNEYDLAFFNIPWAEAMHRYGLSVYGKLSLDILDYPPLYLVCLWPVSGLVAAANVAGNTVALMFWIKLVPCLFDLGLVVLFWRVGHRVATKNGLFAALIWALNPATVFNCAVWGQTDCILIFFIALCALSFYDKKPAWGTVWFAFGCLAKLQMAYLLPVLLLELFFNYRVKRALSALVTGAAVGILGWLPFSFYSGNLKLLFDVYFSGFDKYPYMALSAFNLYGLMDCNKKPVELSIIGGLSGQTLSTIFTVLLLAGLCLGYFFARRSKTKVPFYLHGLFFMNGIFLLTVKMHERYQVPVLVFAVLCWLIGQRKEYKRVFFMLLAITTANQALTFFQYTTCKEGWYRALIIGLVVGSELNLVLFAWLTVRYFRLCLGKKAPQAAGGDFLPPNLPCPSAEMPSEAVSSHEGV